MEPVPFSPVMNGCCIACWGDQRLIGSRLSSPSTKSVNDARIAISLSISACLALRLPNWYVRMISGKVEALKYCLEGCSCTLCSFEYCSIDLRR